MHLALILLNSWITFGYNFWCYVPIDVTWTITVWMIFWILLCLLHVLTDNRQHYLLLLFKIKFMKVKGISCSLFNVIWLQIWMKGRQLFTPSWVAYIGLHCHLKNKHNCDNENCVLFACNFYGKKMSKGTIGPRASSHYQIWPSLKKVWTPLL